MVLPHSENIMVYPARFQFGQYPTVCGGSSCCTDTCIQMIVEYYKEKHYDLATIRKLAQRNTSFNERPCSGINGIEVLNALKNLGITHYRIGWGVDAADINVMKNVGPTLVGVHYGSYPNKPGRCAGTYKAELGGRTDCNFRGAHAVLVVGGRKHLDSTGRYLHTDLYSRDPDHNSPSRPEKPPYDRIKMSDFNIAMRNLPKYTAFRNTYAVYPTKKKVI